MSVLDQFEGASLKDNSEALNTSEAEVYNVLDQILGLFNNRLFIFIGLISLCENLKKNSLINIYEILLTCKKNFENALNNNGSEKLIDEIISHNPIGSARRIKDRETYNKALLHPTIKEILASILIHYSELLSIFKIFQAKDDHNSKPRSDKEYAISLKNAEDKILKIQRELERKVYELKNSDNSKNPSI